MADLVFKKLPAPAHLQEQSRNAIHEAGVWGLFVDAKLLDGGFPDTCRWLTVLLDQVRISFPWGSIMEAEVGIASGAVNWQREDIDFHEWLIKHVTPDDTCGGLTASLDLELRWRGLDGEHGESVFTRSGRFLIDPHPLSRSPPSEVYCAFIVNLNVFTNAIWCDEISAYIDITEAAQRNRRQLTDSLRKWEAASGGEIREWESSMVSGIERYGFSDTCFEQ